MTWTKLGAEFNSECALAGLSDAAYRTHSEAIGWLYEVEETSCRIPKRLFQRLAGSEDAEAAVGQLTGIGFWKDAGAVWVVLHHTGVVRQSIAAQQDKRSRDAKAQRRRRRKVSADVSADIGAESAAAPSDRQTDRRSARPRRTSKPRAKPRARLRTGRHTKCDDACPARADLNPLRGKLAQPASSPRAG